MKADRIIKVRDRALKLLAGRLKGFYLAGGTALSLFYFHHRESYDLDFFTQEFSTAQIESLIRHLSESMGAKIELTGEQKSQDKARMLVYSLEIGKDTRLKIDFIEDMVKLVKPPKIVDGLPVMAVEDIYARKILAVCGTHETADVIGRKKFIGGRREPKDYFDLYFLSRTFMPLSKFVTAHCHPTQIESVIVWYRTYDRMAIKLGLQEIITDKKIDVREMERHFRDEIEEIIRREI